MEVLNFDRFLSHAGLNPQDFDDEEATLALVRHLVNETSPRILIEDFPRTEKQARLFIRNSVLPTEVFYVKCSKDVCQERLMELEPSHPSYISSTSLTQHIQHFTSSLSSLLPFLSSACSLRTVNGEETLANVLAQVFSVVEPTVIHVRNGLPG
jgi:adenylate kinase family enzyme